MKTYHIKPPKKKKTWKDILLDFVLLGCLAAFLFAGWKLATAFIEYRRGEENYESIIQDAVILPSKEIEDKSEEELLPVIDWAKLKSMSPDFIGWLYIPDTSIQYPIVSSKDDEYYLSHTFDRTKNSCGSIFMDKSNKKDFTSDNTVLHGHNMKNGTMFGSLRKFEDKAYWEKHPYIWIIREDTAVKYEIFAVSITEAAGDVYTLEFATEKSFQNYIADRKKVDAIFDTGVNVATSDRILTLSTCTSDTETGRRVVQAKLVDEKVIQ